MREYETVFLLHPSLDEKEVEAQVQTVCDLITSTGGTVEDIERWGRRRLAYEIQKVHDGTYTLVRFKSESNTLNELSRRYRLNEKLLRHLTIRSEGPPPPPPRPESEMAPRHEAKKDEGEFDLSRSPAFSSGGTGHAAGSPTAAASAPGPEPAGPDPVDAA